MKSLWGELYDENRERYEKARPKRGRFIYEYFSENGQLDDVKKSSFLEFGAFSAKDSSFLKNKLPDATCYISDLEVSVLKGRNNLIPFAANIFRLPVADNSVDYSFHSGLVVLFGNDEVKEIISNQIKVTKKCSFVFALNAYNFVDHMMAFWLYRIRRNKLYKYRRFSKKELLEIVVETNGIEVDAFYFDNTVVNFASRSGSVFLKFIARLPIFKAPFFYNEVVLVVKKCAG